VFEGDGWNAAYSCMVGGLVYLICQYFFALIFFSKGGAQQANQIIKRLFLGEGLKLILTLFSLASIFYYQLAQPFPLLLGFILMIMVGWILPWVLKV
jgi:F0F1-type ATP synthase assembly protein I